jgi:putative endonuclease
VSDGTQTRQAALRRGRRAERRAAWRLRLKGFRILARNLRTPVGEIDLVARRFNLVVFVEVKARDGEAAAAESLGPRQRARIGRAAAYFLSRRPDLAACRVRFDAMLCAPGRLPRHVIDAWRDSGGGIT